jgi:hypothetical protein
MAGFAVGSAEGSSRDGWGLAAGVAGKTFATVAVEDAAESLVLELASSSVASVFPRDAAAAPLAGLPGAGLASLVSLVAAIAAAPVMVCVDRLPML